MLDCVQYLLLLQVLFALLVSPLSEPSSFGLFQHQLLQCDRIRIVLVVALACLSRLLLRHPEVVLLQVEDSQVFVL